ncbi:MAG: anaerobic sulfite reductase subunit AsrA [Treponemataceae bacterium]
MKKQFNTRSFNAVLKQISNDFDVYAPQTFEAKGMFSDTPLVRYDKILDIENINTKDKSWYSPKEVILPITQRLFYFNETEFSQPPLESLKPVLIFIRSCDLHAFNKLDHIYLKNKFSDHYYQQARNKVKFALLGCDKSWNTCFCVSMETNKASNYHLGINIEENGSIFVEVADQAFSPYFANAGEKTDFTVHSVSENIESVHIANDITLQEVKDLPLWDDYDRCITCGRCNFVCPTCSCYTTQDIFYKDNPRQGERRRVWASCHVDGFSTMAGGHEFRKKVSDRMRFKVMHKIADFKKRFGEHMCVGCGRCDTACPEYISYINCINKVSTLVETNRGVK